MDAQPDSQQVSTLVGAVLDEDSLDDLLQRVVHLAKRAVPEADSVSITVADGNGYRTSNSTGPDALAVDQAQYDSGAGPCLQGMQEARQGQWTFTEAKERWPLVAAQARTLGIEGGLSTPLIIEGRGSIGALNVYVTREGEFSENERAMAELLSDHAAVLLDKALALTSATRLTDQLREAVASREIIGEAKGILMERESCNRDQAFDMLRRASQRENRKLRDLAEDLVLRVEARKQPGGMP